ncbi:hypothetical protein IHO40_04340 [Wolbachia endosymbiont of Mansonella ozzardi]|uniref:hypothetical protein n=1 Tax=Wolbachia endosymbiont of Mansonella ozzardi TaxID=137464 RepID=UPI001CE087ED|nr:hypothetical protein [Wolbachia endosymbiont of Mansonella ozzardi]MCA4775308.1 hypothetical protein [Wolbachia endosymbiont of Mansonella ozzardi]
MLSTKEKVTYFTKLKTGGRFAIYTFGIYLAATFTIGCLGLIIGSSLLTFPLAMLISNPVVWVLMGIAFVVVCKVAVEPLYRLVRELNGKRTSKVEGVEPQELQEQENTVVNQKELDKDSGIVPGSEPGSKNSSRRNSAGSGLGGKEFYENLDTLVHKTNRENYTYWLQQHDIAHIARAVYNYSESSDGHIFFCIPGNLESLNERLKEYKNKAERENSKRIFTSVINLGSNHWVTLVVAYNLDNEQFRAYYCDSFSTNLSSPGSKRSSIKLANEVKGLISPLTEQASELNAQGRKEMDKDVQKTAQTCRDKKNELVNVPINTDNIVSALEEILRMGSGNIKSSKTKQQSDGCNCGIFALENAHKITQMLIEGKSFDEINKELSKYKFNLNGKRREFAEALMNDEKWKEDLKNGLLCDFSPGMATSISPTSKMQNIGQVCNTIAIYSTLCPSK